MRHPSSTCIIAFLCSLWLCIIPSQSPARSIATVTPAIKAAPLQAEPPEFQKIKEKLALLLVSNPSQNNAEAWKKTASQFGVLYQRNQSTDLGAECLYLQARTYQLMCIRFKDCAEGELARNTFLQLAEQYPTHSRSDDALFQAALLTPKGDAHTPTATALYQRILDNYPQGDYAAKAAQQLGLKRAEKKSPEGISPLKTTTQASATILHQGNKLSTLPEISKTSFWSSTNYSRLVISAERPLRYQMDKNENSLLLNLEPCTLNQGVQPRHTFSKGLLQTVQLKDNAEGKVQMHLQLNPYQEVKTFILNNPYRLVVDIYGIEQKVDKGEKEDVTANQKVENKKGEQQEENGIEESTLPLLSDIKKYGPTGPNPHIKLQPEPLSLTQQLGLGVKTIVIDPGHGGKDPGAMANGLKEKDIVLKIAKELAQILKQDFQYQVILTRESDIFIPLEKRTEIANRKKADLFVSIHINAHTDTSNTGIETYFLNLATDADAMRVAALENASSTHSIGELQDILASLMNNSKIDESSRLARFVQNNLINGMSKKYRQKNLGVKQAPFYVLIGAEMPAILAELSFITNPRDARLLKSQPHLESLARQLAKGIAAYVDHHQAAVRLY